MIELQATLNRLAGTTGLDAQGAANVIAGTTSLDLVGALNAKAGTDGLELNGVCKALASQYDGNAGLDAQGALGSIASLDALDAPLTDAVVLLRASQFAGAEGDDWPNEGTGGSTHDATAEGELAGEPLPPSFVTSPEPGFVTGGTDGDPVPHYAVPNGAAIDITTGSFTVAYRVLWTDDAQGAFDPLIAKIVGSVGSDGDGWIIADGSAIAGAGAIVSQDAAFAPALGTGVGVGEHLVVGRLNRDASPDEVALFVDNVQLDTSDASSVANITSTNGIIIGRSSPRFQTARDVVFWDRALTDTEITVDLPAALGFS